MGIAVSPQIHPRVAEFIDKPRQMLINGQWVEAASGKTFPTYNPATGEVSRASCGRRSRRHRSRREAARQRSIRPVAPHDASERGRLIWKLADLLEQHLEEFAQLECLDNGKPLNVAAADVPLAVDCSATWPAGPRRSKATPFRSRFPTRRARSILAYTLREPVGVVGQIIPWNFPLLMAAWKLGPALAAGCTVVLKPAEQTPLSALRLGELIQEAGFPDGVVNIVPGFGETAGAALAAHPDVDKVAFTGSTEVGKLIVQAAAGNLKKVSLELGGKSPNIVFEDADLDAAIPGAASAIFFNHGQCCCAGSRLYVEKAVFDKVVEGVAQTCQRKSSSAPAWSPTREMGPLVSEEQLNRVCGYLESGNSEGAKAVTGGTARRRPRLLRRAHGAGRHQRRHESRAGGNLRAGGHGDAVQRSRRSRRRAPTTRSTAWPPASGRATSARRITLAEQLRAGTVWINCYNIFDAALPFGGYKQSGWGREMGHDVLKLYTQTKAVCARVA